MARNMTVRIDDDLWKEIEVVARISGRSVTSIVRESIAKLISEQTADAEFQRQARLAADENRSRLARFERP